jgi:uncharacterized protein YecT (DUF1311 family)
MKKADHQKIIDWNKRRGDKHRLGVELSYQIDVLAAEAEQLIARHSDLIEFIPIRLVTILEVFVRGTVSELVNSREDFFDRGDKLVKGAKIDLAFAAHIDRRELTIGDFVAHAISITSVESVLNVFETLLPDFVVKLRSSHERWSEQIDQWPLSPIVNDYNKMLSSLSRLFEVRHILTHELPQAQIFFSSEIASLVSAVRSFILATDWVIVEVLFGHIPETQTAMNIAASEDLVEEEARLSKVLTETASLNGMEAEALDALQYLWSEWANLQANLVASQVQGGSMYSMVWAAEKSVLTRERREQLSRLKTQWMDQ